MGYRSWSDVEDGVLVDARRRGETFVVIAQRMPGRSASGVADRYRLLAGRGLVPAASDTAREFDEQEWAAMARRGSRRLLKAMLAYYRRRGGRP